MKIKANLLYKPGNFQMDDCQIEKMVELSREEFGRLKLTPLADQPFIRENRGCMFSKDGVMHCLLNARVSEICETPEGTEVVLTGVDPEELARFNEAFDAFLEAEQAMGPAM